MASEASGVPNVGAPDCIDSVDTNVPKITGAPGRTNCVNAVPAMTSARTCVSVAAIVTGLIAPARIKGVMMHA